MISFGAFVYFFFSVICKAFFAVMLYRLFSSHYSDIVPFGSRVFLIFACLGLIL